jgi:hypothetical protein
MSKKGPLPADVELLPWLATQLDISKATAYRLAKTGQLERWGVFKVGSQYRVSVLRFNREFHGDEGAKMMAEAWLADAVES